MSSAYAATLKTLPARISPTIMPASQAGAGTSVSSTTATITQTGTMTARCRRTVRNRHPASVSSCLTQSLLSSGSRNPSAKRSQRSGPGSPGILAIVLSSPMPCPRASAWRGAVRSVRSARDAGGAGGGAVRSVRSARDAADRLAGRDRLADADVDLGHGPVLVRRQRLLHLHGLENNHRLAGGHPLALVGHDLDD